MPREGERGGPGLLGVRAGCSPPQGPAEAEQEAGQRAQEVGQADAVGRAALGPRPVGAVEEVGVVEGLGRG